MTRERLKLDVWRLLPEWLEANPEADDMQFYTWLGRSRPALRRGIDALALRGDDPWQIVHNWMNEYLWRAGRS